MTYKKVTQKSYQGTAEAFARNVAEMAPIESIEKFIKFLPSNAHILDVGCGSGRDAKIFTEKGISVLGVDFCANLIDIAKLNAPLADFQLLDIEEASFPVASFDGVWASCSLSHIPKPKLPVVLANIHSCLKSKGYFYLTLKKGIGEILEKDGRYEGDFKKFWAFYEEEELTQIVQSAELDILECCTVHKESVYRTHVCIRIFCQKKT